MWLSAEFLLGQCGCETTYFFNVFSRHILCIFENTTKMVSIVAVWLASCPSWPMMWLFGWASSQSLLKEDVAIWVHGWATGPVWLFGWLGL
jgi:hypothetical protein